MRDRLANLERIRELDPDRDYVAIYQIMYRFEFPWDMRMSLNLAFNRSFSTPTVAKVLVGTGEFTERAQKRIDDTGILMKEILLNGFESERGREAVRRVNQIHRPYRDVPADEYLYVLAAGAVISLRWLDRYGWRPLSEHERRATFRWYSELGRMMHVSGIPDTLEELEAWFDAFDEAQLVPNDDAATVERATRSYLLARVPPPLAPLGNALVSALYDDRLRAAVKVAPPAWPVRAGLHATLRARKLLLRHFGRPRTVGQYAEGIVTKTYPDGYRISEVGPA
ncbi:DUF2236 domain-containing protein [Actinoplanes sp. TBRC 11911]|uniref:oxygenase MpaB family protein n=1 Tax=Actinoplanes sp. TBRC 11911 TaxID=2729386 RepID=UPI00145D1B31|nr:oxygenase MpaB family protein [Actinoplanes sp. TBRC 11911]NMO56732.1 DUF2236 domain-containing protein [Actinoplanes sp. TBRC 11911]